MWKQITGMLVAIALGVGVAWYAVQWRAQSLSSVSPSSLPTGGDFTLNSVQGTVNLTDLRGKVVVLYFGYTACPDICPTSMATLKGGLGQLTPTELQQVQGLFISVDPERDTLENIQHYASYFHPNILAASGKLEDLQQIAQQYHAFFRKVTMPGSAMAYSIDHTSLLYIIDKQGKVRETVQHVVPPAELAAAIRRYL